jgi:hypothetical protein
VNTEYTLKLLQSLVNDMNKQKKKSRSLSKK